jgi:hypothetical protein
VATITGKSNDSAAVGRWVVACASINFLATSRAISMVS